MIRNRDGAVWHSARTRPAHRHRTPGEVDRCGLSFPAVHGAGCAGPADDRPKRSDTIFPRSIIYIMSTSRREGSPPHSPQAPETAPSSLPVTDREREAAARPPGRRTAPGCNRVPRCGAKRTTTRHTISERDRRAAVRRIPRRSAAHDQRTRQTCRGPVQSAPQCGTRSAKAASVPRSGAIRAAVRHAISESSKRAAVRCNPRRSAAHEKCRAGFARNAEAVPPQERRQRRSGPEITTCPAPPGSTPASPRGRAWPDGFCPHARGR